MGNFNRPDSYDINNVVGRVVSIEQCLRYVLGSRSRYEVEVAQAYDRLMRNSVEESLKNCDIEILNSDKAGIRLAALRDAGINNIYTVLQHEAEDLMEINGIGEDTAIKILRRARAVRREVMRSGGVRLDYDKRTKESSIIVKRIGLLHFCRNIFDEALSIYNQYDEMITCELSKAAYMKSTLKWLFTSADVREECLRAYRNLEHFLTLPAAGRAKKLADMLTELELGYTEEVSWKNFKGNTAPFYSMLEKVLPQTAGTVGIYGKNQYVPDELVEEIEGFILDTSLLKATLRSYQEFGTKFILNRKKVLLGDEMGLGKTVQAIAAMAHLKAGGKSRFLVVCPVSVLINWEREIEQHSHLKAMDIYGTGREEEYEEWMRSGGVGVTTFETVSKVDFGTPQLDMLVVDEAHYIKNPGANRTKALSGLMTNADNILLMTGTPLENKVDEMKILIGYLQPEIAEKVSMITSVANAERFREDIAPVYLRRVREDVLRELPEKIEKEEWCAMGSREKSAYVEALRSGNYMRVRQVSWNVENLEDSGKACRLLEICETAGQEGRKVVVFSYFTDTIQKVSALLGEKCTGVIDGSVPAAQRQQLIDEFGKADEGSVLVCQIVAAGVGLNIQSASVVIICEPQWKPSTENQAISRVYRMGQAQSVSVHRLLTIDSVDEELLAVLRKKTEIFNEFADESVMGELNAGESERKFMESVIRKELEKYSA